MQPLPPFPPLTGFALALATRLRTQVNRERYATDHFGSLEQTPTHATTIGLGVVMRAKELCLCVVGSGKVRCAQHLEPRVTLVWSYRVQAALLAQALHGPVTTMLPASLVQLGASVRIFVDADAAAHLKLEDLAARPGWAVVRGA
jgi:glucosamine-6-phosphate deaminase